MSSLSNLNTMRTASGKIASAINDKNHCTFVYDPGTKLEGS